MKKIINCKRNRDGRPKYKQNTEEKRTYNRNYYIANPWQRTYKRCETRARHDKNCRYYGMEFTITSADVKRVWERDGADYMIKPSIDRINSKLGYLPDNIQIIPLKENLRKSKRERTI